MNGLGKPFRKKNHPVQKIEKTVKTKVNLLAACEQKTTGEKRNFAQTPFSRSTLKLKRKNFTPQNHSIFCSISCFGVAKITTPI